MPHSGWLPWLHRASPSATLDKLLDRIKENFINKVNRNFRIRGWGSGVGKACQCL